MSEAPSPGWRRCLESSRRGGVVGKAVGAFVFFRGGGGGGR